MLFLVKYKMNGMERMEVIECRDERELAEFVSTVYMGAPPEYEARVVEEVPEGVLYLKA